MKDKREMSSETTDVSGKIVGAIQITTSIENRTQWTKAKTKGAAGFMAEDANSAHDRFCGKKVEDTGRNNAKDGADRIVDGVCIQTKYYDTATKTVNSAFNKTTGSYRYSQEGKPMTLEVPKDQYEQAVKLMKKKIEEGKVPGVTNPDEAGNIVKAGNVTYKQARNIAKAGNIDSLWFDAKMSAVSTASAFGISFIITFGLLKYKDVHTKDALKISFTEALKTGGITLGTSILTRQLLRTSLGRGLAAISTQCSKSAIHVFYSSPAGKEVIHKIACMVCEKQVYGVAARNVVVKFVRTNVMVNTVMILVNTVPDFLKFMDNRISWKELTLSITHSVTGLAAFVIGTRLGAQIPAPAPVKVGLSLLTGVVSSLTASEIISRLFKNNQEKKEYELIQMAVRELSQDYMIIDEEEFDRCIGEIQKREIINEDFIAHIRARQTEGEQRAYVYTRLKSCFAYVIQKRKTLEIPDEQQILEEINEIELSENEIEQIVNNPLNQ